jgi:hypothetical protein
MSGGPSWHGKMQTTPRGPKIQQPAGLHPLTARPAFPDQSIAFSRRWNIHNAY